MNELLMGNESNKPEKSNLIGLLEPISLNFPKFSMRSRKIVIVKTEIDSPLIIEYTDSYLPRKCLTFKNSDNNNLVIVADSIYVSTKIKCDSIEYRVKYKIKKKKL